MSYGVNILDPDAVLEIAEVQRAAGTVGLDAMRIEIRAANDIAPAFQTLTSSVQALLVVSDALVGANRKQIIALSLEHHMPTIFNDGSFVQGAGMMSYGPSFPSLFRRDAELVDKILRGTKPGDIPIEQPTKFELFLNLKTASALGLTVPPTLLVLADEVIERRRQAKLARSAGASPAQVRPSKSPGSECCVRRR
jgi:putative ABC transport system substrate-binding protein